jgi:CheY-like chemotaxis protein
MSNSRVLVVDDDPNLTDLLVDTLETIGYLARPAASAQEALALLASEHFDLVISDINMPEMSGIELLQQIKREHHHLPVMLITGISTETVKAQAYSSGADGFLAKPFRIGSIESEIAKLLQNINRRRVVVIDDNEDFLLSLKARLEERDNVVTAFTNVSDSVKYLDEHAVDLVITDLKMPDGDGITLVEMLHERYPDLPVIMVSAYATEGLIARIKEAGVNRFLPKPIDFKELDEALERCVTK